jgi:hypothetical protein
MRRLTALALAAAVVACGGKRTQEDKAQDPVHRRQLVEAGLGPWDLPGERMSKTIHYVDENTVEGTLYLGGHLVVEKIIAQETDDVFSTNVRLRNTTGGKIAGHYLIRFYDREKNIIVGYKWDWDSFIVEPYGLVTLSNSSMVGGAQVFKLLIKGPGAAPAPDPAAPKSSSSNP